MRTKVLSPNQRILVGVVEQSFGGREVAMFARTLKKVGLTLEVEERDKDLVLYAARRVVTNDISVPLAEPKPKPKNLPVVKSNAA